MRCILYSKKNGNNLYIHHLLKVKVLCSFYNWAFDVFISCVWLFVNPRIPRCHVSLSFTISLFAQTHVLWVDDAIQLAHPLSSPSPPALNLSQPQGLFQWVNSLPHVTKILELQNQSFQLMFKVDFLWIDWLDLLAVQGVLKSSPAPQFKNINSLVLSLLYGPTLTFVHNYWKKPQLWLYGPLWVKWCLCFLICCLDLFPSKEQVSFNFVAAVTIHNDFGAQENEVCHCFHFLFSAPICHEVMGLDAIILVFCMLSLSQPFQSPLSPSSWGSLVPLCFLP